MRRMTMFLVGVAIAVPALAVIVPATGDVTLALPGTTSAADPSLASSNVSDKLIDFSTPAGVTPIVSGKLQVRVAKSTSTGALIYSWRFINSPNSSGNIRSLSVIGFPAASYDANWRPDGSGTIAPKSLLVFGAAPARIMAFQFSDGIPPGKESKFFFLKTTAKTVDTATAIARIKFSPSGSVDIVIPKPKA